MNRIAIGYIRVSSLGQAVEGISLEAQAAKIRVWAAANDYEVQAIHQDAGVSGGKTTNRPALQKALQEATDGKALIVYSLSRLARSTKDAIAISERLAKAGADLVSVSEKIDTTSASGKMVFRLMAVLSEFERDLVAERTKLAMAHLRSQGKRVGQVPFGWKLCSGGKKLKVDEREQIVIKTMLRLRKRGRSFNKIAAGLAAKGCIAKSGRCRWSGKVVRGILRGLGQDRPMLAAA